MKYQLLMECRGGVRHAFKTVMIIELPDGTSKLHKICTNCKSQKFPIWNARGQILKSPTYKHSPEYREFLDNHTPAEARMAILASDIRKVKAPNEKNGTVLRLVSRTRKSNRHAHARKRPRDKKRSQS